ncbi:MAG TPA: copper amine oxidase N-terminal domain-containing protein [Candidatus Deferrimicrobium sp.]|nr:copper amine oxidase N-terminal domain-containing protein [Candidatus Deferrimicrobium sp.]
MKKSLSVFVALAMVLSLFTGVGARSAWADVTLTVTPSGNFVGGVDARGITPVDAIGTVASITDGTHAVVNVTTTGAGRFGATPNVSILRATVATSTDPHWAVSGDQWITFGGGYAFVPGDSITVAAATRNGAGTIISCNAPTTLAEVHVTTAAVGAIGPAIKKTVGTTFSTDVTWEIAGSHTITFTTTAGLNALDVLDVSMVRAVAEVPAVAFLMLGGAVTAGNVASATWQDTTGTSHTASCTVVAGDTLATVTTQLKDAINAVAGGNIIATNASASAIMLTQTVAGTVGNGKKLTTGTTAIAATLTIRTLGGLTSPVLVEMGKTVQLVAVDPTGAIVTAAWTSSLPAIVTVNAGGLVTAMRDSGVVLVTASYGIYTGSFVVIPISPQKITRLAVGLVPARLKVAGRQQFGAIGASTAYGSLDYTTQAVWTDTLRVAAVFSVAPAQGLLTYRAAETGTVSAHAAGLTTTVAVKINAAGAVTIVKVPVVPIVARRVVVLTIGSDIVMVDGRATIVDAAPEIVAGRTFVPIRFIAETFGSTVTWLPETRGITITLGSTTIILQIENATGVINGKIVALDAAPYIKNGRSVVPLRVISESFGSDVAWNAAKHVITITHLLP